MDGCSVFYYGDSGGARKDLSWISIQIAVSLDCMKIRTLQMQLRLGELTKPGYKNKIFKGDILNVIFPKEDKGYFANAPR